MVHADLHVHTDNSDGTLTLDAVPAAAREAGVSVVGVTDHDRFSPDLEKPVEERDGVLLVHGIELRVATPAQRVDLLGYGVEPTNRLREETDRLQQDRIDRGRRIVECLEDTLNVSLDLEIREGLGRPHVARAVVDHPETDYEAVDAVFADLIGDGDPCFVARDVPSFDRGLDLLREASAVVGLAHPYRYPDPGAALDLCDRLDAVERYYPYDRPVGRGAEADVDRLEAVIERHDLLSTGGSDAHERDLGRAGLSAAEWERLAARLPPVS